MGYQQARESIVFGSGVRTSSVTVAPAPLKLGHETLQVLL